MFKAREKNPELKLSKSVEMTSIFRFFSPKDELNVEFFEKFHCPKMVKFFYNARQSRVPMSCTAESPQEFQLFFSWLYKHRVLVAVAPNFVR